MARRFLKKLPRRVLQVVGATLVLGVLAFFALTRTEVGRHQLKEQIEAQFNERFAGQLQIGRLRGNLIGTVYARNVRLQSSGGRSILTVDSVRAVPRWRSLFGRDVFFRDVELIGPAVRLVRAENGTWNLTQAFRRTGPRGSTSGDDPFALSFADVAVRGGQVRTATRGGRPRLVRADWLFDYTNTRLADVNAQFSFERTPGAGFQIDLRQLSGRLTKPGVPIEQAQGQIVVGTDGWALRQLRLRLGDTHVRGSFARKGGSAGASTADSAPAASNAPALQIDLNESRLNHDEIRRLVPRWPLSGTTTAVFTAQGSLHRLAIDQLRVQREASVLQAEGTVQGLPEDLIFDLRFAESRLTARDLHAVLPSLPQDRLAPLARYGTVQFSLDAEGHVAGLAKTRLLDGTGRLNASLQFDVQTPDAGTLHGTADLERQPGQPLAYSADVQADDFDAGRLTARIAGKTSRLTGHVEMRGEGTPARGGAGRLEAQLQRSIVAGRRLEGLNADLHLTSSERLMGAVALRQPGGGALRLNGTADLSGATPFYEATVRAGGLDLSAVVDGAPATTLSGTARLDGRGASLRTLAGRLRLALDSSTVVRDSTERTLAPFTSTLRLAGPDEAGPRIALEGDLADLTVTGEVDFVALGALGQLWGGAFADAWRTAYRKPYRPGAPDRVEALPRDAAQPPRSPPASPAAKQAVRQALQAASLGNGLALQAELALKRPALLKAFFPALPTIGDTLALQVGLQAGAATLSTRGSLHAPGLQTGPLRIGGLASQFRVQASLTAPLLESLDAAFDAEARTLALGATHFEAAALTASYRERTGDLQLSSSAAGNTGRLQLGAGLELLPDRNRVQVRTLRLRSGDYQWRSPTPRPVDLYADAIVVPHLALVNASSAPRQRQRLTVRGALSAAPQDTLFADAEGVLLRPASRVAGLRRPLGGRLTAALAWTGGLETPKVTGRLDVARLAFAHRLLGHLTARSRYVPSASHVAFEAALRPAEEQAPLPGASTLQPVENRLSARGTVALPSLNSEAPETGTLDLSLDIDRADLFFFDYIFDGKVTQSRGALTGTGRIQGSFRDPLFQADLQVRNGAFRIPQFGLRYAAEGHVEVDREGIKIRRARLTDADEGSATVQGALLFNDYEYFSFDLQAALDELQVMNVEDAPDLPFYGQIAASGPVRLAGPLSGARLTSDRVRTTPESELILPIEEGNRGGSESGFLIFADSTGRLPNLQKITHRESILDDRPAGERSFIDGLEMDLGIAAPEGSTVHLVFDPLLGDEITAVGNGQIQLQRQEGALSLFGTFDVEAGHYLFTAGQVFQRRFQIESGTMRWDGPPANAELDLTATYRTRASRAGLPGADDNEGGRIPIIVRLEVNGRVQQPTVDLALAIDRTRRGFSDFSTAGLETILNREDREEEYATSVLLTNTFLLTTELAQRPQQGLSKTGNRLAFNSVSQLVSSQLNRYLSEALPNLDVNLGVQGEDPQDLDVIYGLALRLLDERLVIRGEGVLDEEQAGNQGGGLRDFEGEFVVEVRLTPRVSVEAFYRREGSLLAERALTSTTGAGLSYQTEFPTWKRLWHRLFGWLGVGDDDEAPPQDPAVASGN